MLSFIIPVYDEEESISALYKELISSLLKLKEGFEVLFIDDGSTDNTLNILKTFNAKNKNIRLFSFRRNQGKAEALTLGFAKAKGDLIVTLDADLQDRPDQIEKLIKKQREGWDLVSGWRKNRKDTLPKKISSAFFNILASIFWGLNLHDYNCGLKLYSKEAAKSLRLYGGTYRFIPLLLHEQGFRVSEIPIVHDNRKYGKSKYGISKVIKDIPDMFTMLFLSKYSKKPLHFFGAIGFVLLIIGFIILGYLSVLRFMGEAIGRRPLLFLGMLLVISGLQVFFTGFLADLMIHIMEGSRSKGYENLNLKYSSE